MFFSESLVPSYVATVSVSFYRKLWEDVFFVLTFHINGYIHVYIYICMYIIFMQYIYDMSSLSNTTC